jgi:hypothetical protein
MSGFTMNGTAPTSVKPQVAFNPVSSALPPWSLCPPWFKTVFFMAEPAKQSQFAGAKLEAGGRKPEEGCRGDPGKAKPIHPRRSIGSHHPPCRTAGSLVVQNKANLRRAAEGEVICR